MKKTFILLVVIAVIAAANYHGYRVGVTQGQEADITLLGKALKRNGKCLKRQDIQCLKATNMMLLAVFKMKLSALKEKGIFVDNVEMVDEYISWSEEALMKKEYAPNLELDSYNI